MNNKLIEEQSVVAFKELADLGTLLGEEMLWGPEYKKASALLGGARGAIFAILSEVVVCPVCDASGQSPCRTRFVSGKKSRVLKTPHKARFKKYRPYFEFKENK